MAVRVTRLAPAAAQGAPDQEAREQSLRTLQLELEAQADAGLAALLQHEVARLHERRDDLASAARDELSTTKRAAGFVEPIESLIDIATRSRSKANLTKLLERLTKLARTQEEKLRASLGLTLTHLANDNVEAARQIVDQALEECPTEPALWLALETVAARTGDANLLLKAATGRAAHAESEEMRCLLLERVARLEAEVGTSEAAFDALQQSVDEMPTWSSLRAWEELGLRSKSYEEAQKAAMQTATILRAGLDEPEEAALYQIPEEEMSEERAMAAHIRAIIYALRSDDDESARGLCKQLSESSPHSALALGLLAEVCRKQGDTEGVLGAVLRLIESRKWSAKEAAFLHALSALDAREAGKEEERHTALQKLRALAPQSLLPLIEDWQTAQASDSPDDLLRLFNDWAEAASNSNNSSERAEADSLLLSIALLELILRRSEAARATLAKRTAHKSSEDVTDTLGTLLLYVAESLDGKRAGHVAFPPGVGQKEDRIAASWERLRFDLVDGHLSASSLLDDEESGPTRDPWSSFVCSLFIEPPDGENSLPTERRPVELKQSDDRHPLGDSVGNPEDGVVALLTQPSIPPGRIESGGEHFVVGEPAEPFTRNDEGTRGLLAAYLRTGDGNGPLRRALHALELAGWGDFEQLHRQWELAPTDPLLSGAYLRSLEDRADPALATKRRKAAERQEDGLLRAAWLLKSAADELCQGNAPSAREAYDASGAFSGDTELERWFAASLGPRDPQALAADRSVGLENPLEAAALIRRWSPDQWITLDLASATPALQLLQVLHQASESLEALEYALDDTALLSESERSVLPLARAYGVNESEALVSATGRWVAASPSAASKLTHWVAATRAGKAEDQAKMIEALASDLAAPSLLAAIPGIQLKKEERARHRELLRQQRDSTEGTEAQSLAWAAFDRTDDAITEMHAAELARLSNVLDEGLSDPDAQAALLLAGYEYLALGNFEEAVRLFENLLEVLPGDLTLCHGARIAAARVDRPDLEAITSCELARATEDSLKSAALWERAGVLFQDELDDREEAERCFSAALARSPGSRVSFERIYRFARDRNDRQRQVELIDARLDTADSDRLLIELHWEKARFCRMLGRRAIALRALEELLKLDPGHLPALALAAEFHLVDGRIDAAAEALRTVAKHPDTPAAERSAAGLHACDLFEQLRRHRDAVDLLKLLDEHGVSGSAGLERRARALARAEDWGEAYQAFAALNEQQDQIEARLESAQMMIAIQRDHLKDPEELRRAARSVLRDAPLDQDAILVILEQDFSDEERRRLLAPARAQSRDVLRRNPLNPPEIQRFAKLCRHCGEDYMERIALGILGLTGKLPEDLAARHEKLMSSCLSAPSQQLSPLDLESISDPLQLGAAGRYLSLLAPYLARELDPSLEALGFSSLMRTDEFSGSPHRAEIGIWLGCFGHSDFELYVGGSDPQLIRGIAGTLPTILVGRDIPVPLTQQDRARVVAQLAALHLGMVVYLNHAPEELRKWIRASEILAGGIPTGKRAEEVDELARLLSKTIPNESREELAKLHAELSRAGVDLAHAPEIAMRGAARAVCLAQGESKILRELPDLLPTDQVLMNAMMSDVVRFVLSTEFINIRRRIGLEGA